MSRENPTSYTIRVWHDEYSAVFYESVDDHLKRTYPPGERSLDLLEVLDDVVALEKEGVDLQIVRASFPIPNAERTIVVKREMIEGDKDGRRVERLIQRL